MLIDSVLVQLCGGFLFGEASLTSLGCLTQAKPAFIRAVFGVSDPSVKAIHLEFFVDWRVAAEVAIFCDIEGSIG